MSVDCRPECPQQPLLAQALDELRLTRTRLAQAQKLEAIGQLAAGIAHEINTPSQYVSDNLVFLERAFARLLQALEASAAALETVRGGAPDPSSMAAADRALTQAKLEYLKKQVPRALEQSLAGLSCITTMVQAMKEFSHPSAAEKEPANIHEAIETTIAVARNEWKYVAEVECSFDPALPQVPILKNEFKQVILNLLVNAAHAVSDATHAGADGKGKIRIATRAFDDSVEIRVSDTGTGIPEKIRGRVFEPFFTTKGVGRGTGQGLAIAYSVVVDKHQGSLDFATEEGQGTTFVVRLPLTPPSAGDSGR